MRLGILIGAGLALGAVVLAVFLVPARDEVGSVRRYPRAEERGAAPAAEPELPSVARIPTAAFETSPESLASWFATLGQALHGREADSIEGARSALRHLFAARAPDVPALFLLAKDEAVRAEVIPLVIDVLGPPEPGLLVAWLEGRSARVRAAACLRLARLGRGCEDLLARARPAEDDEALGSEALLWLLRRRGEDGFRQALAISANKERVYAEAVAALIRHPEDADLVGVLKDALREPLPFRLREAIVDAVAATYSDELRATPRSNSDLFSRTSDADVVTKTLAFREAGNFMDAYKTTAPPPIEIERVRSYVREAALRDPDPLVRRAAILSRVGLSTDLKDLAGQCRAVLEIASRDPDPGVRAAALRRVHRGSARSGMPFGPSYLAPYLRNDPDPEVRREALRTLPRWRGRGPDEKVARELVVAALTTDPDPLVRLEAAAHLTDFGFAEARPELERAGLFDPDPKFRDALYEAIRDQIGAADRALFETLRAADARRSADELPTAAPGRPRQLRLDPDYRPAAAAVAAVAAVDAAGEDSPDEPDLVLGEITFDPKEETARPAIFRSVRLFIRRPGSPTLAGILGFPVGKPARLIVVIPPDPLLGGTRAPLSRDVIRDLVMKAGDAVFFHDPRGRGASEGYSGRGIAEREDVAEVLTHARGLLSGAINVDGAVLTGPLRIVALGRGAEHVDGQSTPDSPILELGAVRGEPSSAIAANARYTDPRDAERMQATLDRWIRAR